MTDESPGTGETVSGPPWSVDTLADLHAGALDEHTAARLWPQVRADPQAREVLAALDATTTELGGLASAPVEPMPADVARGIDAALAEQRSAGDDQLAPVVSISTARRRRNRMISWAGGVVTAAAAAIVAIAVIVPTGGEPGEPNVAAPNPGASAEPNGGAPSALALRGGDLGKAVGDVLGVRDFGPLNNEATLDACLAANGIDPSKKALGIRPATIDGQRVVIVLYPTGEYARYRLIALPPDCDKNNPGLVVDKIIGAGGN